MNSRERMQRLIEESQERTRFLKFITYCQMEGLGSIQAEHDRYFSESQARFFSQYEEQMRDFYFGGLNLAATEE